VPTNILAPTNEPMFHVVEGDAHPHERNRKKEEQEELKQYRSLKKKKEELMILERSAKRSMLHHFIAHNR
jgi:hypothetical protein